MFAAVREARGSVGDLRLVYHCMVAAPRPSGGGRFFRGQPEVAQPNAVIESVEVAGIQTVYLLIASPESVSPPTASYANRPLMLSSAELALWASEAAVCMFLTLPLSAPSFCFGLGSAHALRSIRGVQQQDRKSTKVMELIFWGEEGVAIILQA